jgi:photosystem II stability/assembly factor-like uncharacterized protein
MRSTDAGISWQELFSGDATNVALSPDFAHDHAVFAMLGYYNTTLFGSTDAGTTWASFPGPWSTALLRVSPAYVTDHTLYAGANNYSGGGLWRSTDGGMSWNRLPTPVKYYVTGLALPTNTAGSDALLIANQFAWMGIAWLSADRGATWQGVSSGLGDYGLSQAYIYHDATDRVYTFNERGMWWRTMRWR